ncbi:MAG: hypothetical protein WAK11_12815 [Candidatus Cybelea sp.]
MGDRFVWPALFLLGCYHGLNPGMGWLFAVAIGFQERRTIAVVRAIVPLTIGHILSVAIVVAIATFATVQLPHVAVHLAAAAILIGFGIYRLVRARHLRWVGMRVGFWGLVLWGFLMSSAHGAGLMLLPFVTAAHASAQGAMAMPMASAVHGAYALGWLMVGVHTLGYLLTTTGVALLVYTKVGVRFLRLAWLNLDLVWAIALIVTGLIALLT